MSSILSLPNENEIKMLPKDGGNKYNRLIFSNSPYLLQHATNPVDWHEWSDIAFEKARQEDKPVFLSIGYSTCHWCHVMAHESFEDEEIAKLINQFTIPIKVDREERPDIDQIYMAVCQAMSGHGGWPLSAFLTPEKHAFFVTTFIPKDSQNSRMGMRELIPNISYSWKTDREKINHSVNSVIDFFKNRVDTDRDEISTSSVTNAYRYFNEHFDQQFGGFGSSPKFPSPHNLLFLLKYYEVSGQKEALEMAEKTLIEMRMGGIFDQIGYGFHRYSTDKYWLVPHFEKMLYDQAMLMIAYSETFNLTKTKLYKNVVYEILEYLDRDLKSSNSSLYFSAEDADSEGEEGLFYTWTMEEIKDNCKEINQFIELLNIEEDGNYLDEHLRRKTRRNIPFLKNQPIGKVKEELNNDIAHLLEIRSKRVRPHLDDKILLDWNALILASLSKSATYFSDEDLLRKAVLLEKELYSIFFQADRLFHRNRNGNIAIEAMIDDFAFFIWAEIELYKSSYKIEYLEKALALQNIVDKKFWDSKNGFYYYCSEDAENIVGRQKEYYDGAIPSGNSVMFYNLVQLYQYSSELLFKEKIELILSNLPKEMQQHPAGFSMFHYAYQHYIEEKTHLVVISDDLGIIEKIKLLNIDNLTIILLSIEMEDLKGVSFLNSFSREKEAFYLCEQFVCREAIFDFELLKKELLEQH
jgi:uncharacterized protein